MVVNRIKRKFIYNKSNLILHYQNIIAQVLNIKYIREKKMNPYFFLLLFIEYYFAKNKSQVKKRKHFLYFCVFPLFIFF